MGLEDVCLSLAAYDVFHICYKEVCAKSLKGPTLLF